MHSTTGVTDQFYSNMNDEEKKKRIDSMFIEETEGKKQSEEYKQFLEFLSWKKANNQ
jgi:hypothetical protein